MRAQHFALAFFAALAVACSKDSSSGSTPTTPTPPSTSTIGISVDSALVSRTAVVGSVVPAMVHVTQSGQPASGITITWTVSTGGGSVASPTTVSDASGVATNTWTLSDTARTSTLTAGVVNVASATLQVTTTAGPPVAVAKASPDSVGVVAGANTLLTVHVTDKSGNAVPGVSVAWSATGGTLTAATTVTGPSGNGQVVFSTETVQKSYTVTATVAGIGALTFKVVGL